MSRSLPVPDCSGQSSWQIKNRGCWRPSGPLARTSWVRFSGRENVRPWRWHRAATKKWWVSMAVYIRLLPPVCLYHTTEALTLRRIKFYSFISKCCGHFTSRYIHSLWWYKKNWMELELSASFGRDSYWMILNAFQSLPSRLGLWNTPTAYLQRSKTPANEGPGYNSKQSDSEVPVMQELWGMRSTPSLPSLPGPLWLGVVVSERFLSMG